MVDAQERHEQDRAGELRKARYNYQGCVVLVTGGAKGIGRAIAEAFSTTGARVVIVGRDSEALASTAAELSVGGRDVTGIRADVRDIDSLTAMIEQVDRELGRLDVLVNNAGGVFRAPLESLSPNGWRALIETNLSGVFYTSKTCLPLLRQDGGGVVINISSVAGAAAHPLRAAYGAAKAGVNNLTMSMAHEWAPYGIRVNGVAPGAVLTPGSRFSDPAVAAAAEESIPLGRLGRPDEIADACLFLASADASYVTGTTLTVDGGPRRSLSQAAEPGVIPRR